MFNFIILCWTHPRHGVRNLLIYLIFGVSTHRIRFALNRARATLNAGTTDVTTASIHSSATDPLALIGSSWWVWLALIERQGDRGFVYGCAARRAEPVGWNDKAIFELPGGGRLSAYQFTISDES